LSILAAIARVGASPVAHQLGGLHRKVAEAFINVDHRANEVHTDLLGGTSSDESRTELQEFLQSS
jgi:hypothetical protein